MDNLSAMRALLLGLVLLAIPALSHAQTVNGYGTARAVGSIRDSVTGVPLVQAFFCAGTPGASSGRKSSTCASTDNQGRFMVDSLPAGRYEAHWQCWGKQWIGRAKWIGRDTLIYEDGQTTELTLLVDSEGCDQRPREVRHGQFSGYYTSGFEVQAFVSLREPEASTWVELGDTDRSQLPRSDSVSFYSCVYVEWTGEMYGPGYFGHMSAYEYKLTVDSILVAKAVEGAQCK